MSMRSITASGLGSLAIIAAAATPAAAAVVFDPVSGSGFVGKGDVQLAFGWNNSALQSNAAGVGFSYESTDNYSAVCTWTTGTGTRGEKTHNVSHKRHTRILSSVAYEARRQTGGLGQITGFNLTGFGATSEEGSAPVVGAPCPGNEGHSGLWTSVELVSSSGGLFTTYGGTSVLLQ